MATSRKMIKGTARMSIPPSCYQLRFAIRKADKGCGRLLGFNHEDQYTALYNGGDHTVTLTPLEQPTNKRARRKGSVSLETNGTRRIPINAYRCLHEHDAKTVRWEQDPETRQLTFLLPESVVISEGQRKAVEIAQKREQFVEEERQAAKRAADAHQHSAIASIIVNVIPLHVEVGEEEDHALAIAIADILEKFDVDIGRRS